MPLSWNEIRSRAVAFSKEWAGESREQAEAKTFWDEFFRVFGLTRRHLASFEEPVKNLGGNYGFIDLFWKGVLLAEHKSRGKNLGKAHAQAMDYIQSLQREDRREEVPQYVIVSDFARIALHDLEEDVTVEFPLAEFHQNVNHFGFIPGYKQHKLEPEDPINIKAVRIMGDLHDALEAGGYCGHELERLLVRILFCLFAEDTGIFERDAFKLYLENHTKADGSDLGPLLAQFFQVLNKPKQQRQANLREELAELPYVNGELFAESLSFAAFDRDMRNRLVACTTFHWSRISPAVFGALFQAVMEDRERRQIGAHYTSERDILKVIGPLFLDDLKAELARAKNDKGKLRKLHKRLAAMRLLDPACGCGNFLVVSYRELRLLELEILRRLLKGQQLSAIGTILKLDVDQMYGIEIEEWPVRIAEVAMWLMDHQMNQRLSEEFGEYFVRLPLSSSPHIHHGNALRIDWNDVLPAGKCTHVLGNPPFVGKHYMTEEQKADLRDLVDGFRRVGDLDYVCGWYFRACEYISGLSTQCAFVSTNSISQGELAITFWPELISRYGVKIQFAHRTFIWRSEARGSAHVHVVIVGFALSDRSKKLIFDYDGDPNHPTTTAVPNISPYLVAGNDDDVVAKQQRPLCEVPEMRCGNKPTDGGNLILSKTDRENLLAAEPQAEQFVRSYIGSKELINSLERYCLWLEHVDPTVLRSSPLVLERIRRVKEFRVNSTARPTQRSAATPTRFFFVSQPSERFVAVPEVSSSNRRYIPICMLEPSTIVSNKIYQVATPSLYIYGVLQSSMHMAWMRQVGGRLKSDYQYSATIVYNTFPWPPDVSDAKRAAVEKAAQLVLDAREAYPDASLADLYDPLAMPADLTKAHARLDRAVDRCYRSQPFPNERNRVEYLFNLYQKLTTPLLPTKKGRRNSRRKTQGRSN